MKDEWPSTSCTSSHCVFTSVLGAPLIVDLAVLVFVASTLIVNSETCLLCSGVNPLKSEVRLFHATTTAKEAAPCCSVQPVNDGKTTVTVFSEKCTRRIRMVCGRMQRCSRSGRLRILLW